MNKHESRGETVFWLMVFLVIILFGGEPDIHDAIVELIRSYIK